MRDEHSLHGVTKISERGKHRLRIAARFLRLGGHRFNDGNFYASVIHTINQLDGKTCDELHLRINWAEAYELAEIKHWGRHERSRARKNKTVTCRKRD